MKTNNNECYKSLSDNDKNSWRILECYFRLKEQLPDEVRNLVSSAKTTEQIIDDLSPMCSLSPDFVVNFMMINGFGLENQPDGTVAWQIWEIL